MARRRHGTRKGGRKRQRFTFREGQAGGTADALIKQLTIVQSKQEQLDKAIEKLEEVCRDCTKEAEPSGDGKPGSGPGPDAQGNLGDEEKEAKEKAAKEKAAKEEAVAAELAKTKEAKAKSASTPSPGEEVEEGEGGVTAPGQPGTEVKVQEPGTAAAPKGESGVGEKDHGGGGGGFLEAFFSGGGRRRRRGKTCGRAPVRRRTRRR